MYIAFALMQSKHPGNAPPTCTHICTNAGDEGTGASDDQPQRPKPKTGGSAGRPRKADPKTGAKVAPVEVPEYDEEQELSLTEAVSVEQEKEDTRRFSHHRCAMLVQLEQTAIDTGQ